MPDTGRVTSRKTRTHIILSDGSGGTYTLPRCTERPLLFDIDPRIDLTKPIFEQVRKVAAKDKTALAKVTRRKRLSRTA